VRWSGPSTQAHDQESCAPFRRFLPGGSVKMHSRRNAPPHLTFLTHLTHLTLVAALPRWVHLYYYPLEFARLAQISLSSFNLFNPFNSFNFGCGFAALGPSVVKLFWHLQPRPF
jgi:hypothetical protein